MFKGSFEGSRVFEISSEGFWRVDVRSVVDELVQIKDLNNQNLKGVKSAFSFVLDAVVRKERAKSTLSDRDKLSYFLAMRHYLSDVEHGRYSGDMFVVAFYKNKVFSFNSIRLKAYFSRSGSQFYSFKVDFNEELVNVPGFQRISRFGKFLGTKKKVDIEKYLLTLSKSNEELFRIFSEKSNREYILDCEINYNLPLVDKFSPDLFPVVAKALRHGLSGTSMYSENLSSFTIAFWGVPKGRYGNSFLGVFEDVVSKIRGNRDEILFESRYFREPFVFGIKEHNFVFRFNPIFFERFEKELSSSDFKLNNLPYTKARGNMRFVFQVGPFGNKKGSNSSVHGTTEFILDSYSKESCLFVDVVPYYLSDEKKVKILEESLQTFPATYEAVFHELIVRHKEKPIKAIVARHEGLLKILEKNSRGFRILTDKFKVPTTAELRNISAEHRNEFCCEESKDFDILSL